LCISERALYNRLRSPAERFSVDEFASIIESLHISNEEVCEVLRKGA
jgi:hypothetical protein